MICYNNSDLIMEHEFLKKKYELLETFHSELLIEYETLKLNTDIYDINYETTLKFIREK
jgi:hypothetical protein